MVFIPCCASAAGGWCPVPPAPGSAPGSRPAAPGTTRMRRWLVYQNYAAKSPPSRVVFDACRRHAARLIVSLLDSQPTFVLHCDLSAVLRFLRSNSHSFLPGTRQPPISVVLSSFLCSSTLPGSSRQSGCWEPPGCSVASRPQSVRITNSAPRPACACQRHLTCDLFAYACCAEG